MPPFFLPGLIEACRIEPAAGRNVGRPVARSRGCQETLSKIDLGKEIYAYENNVPGGGDDTVGVIESPTCSCTLPSFMKRSAFQHKLVH